ncbi:chloride channel protein 2 isoform X1 [Pectinophora gossypiella]|nr:chloride channel protein 2 isoform X1 [Pectinophora gossypiella]XP_049881463.1 chloride channel protein 2 isoform X1 [Pectinophora gossypiella]XP_049881464.1 chloride channel protein 2 isoform X1 [Pectinophora gossypiella]XP_049881465.1 chloride channel protein 2 isoform X1 [Pectinophora gossypiella]XP_049881467.1 chloride channel protein 2 isoform X1 [Pectinophora gossypiella]
MVKWRKTQNLVSGDTSEEEIGHSYLGTLMYGRYQRDLSEAAREEARRLRRLRKRRRKDDKLRQKELEASGKRPTGKFFKVLGSLWRHTFARLGEDWVFLALLGIIMAIINFAMDRAIAVCNNARMWMYKDLATSTFSQYVAWVSLPICLILFAAGFVHIVAAQSIGSGIPEMKTILRGVHLKEYLTFRALISKIIGLTATLGSGLPLGKEGPSVHIASMVASLLSKLVTTFQGIYSNESRTTEMLAAACAVGVASCFAAPVGGVLFSIEVTTTYFAVRNYWRGFFAACCGAIMFRLLSVWSGATPTVKPLFPTNLPQDFPFDPQEFAVFVLLGIVAGLLAALWVYLHRQYVLFMRNTKVLSNFLQKNRFIYPGFMTLAVMSIFFPPGIGKYMAADLGNQEQVLSLFANFTWGDQLTAEQAAVVDHWRTPEVDHFGCLVIYFFSIYFLAMVSCTLPVPAGIFVPAFKMGASLGRFTGEVMHYFCPLGVAYGGVIQKILPGGYATVGAAAFTGAVTHTVSTIVIVIEMTGQVTHLLPIMAAVLAANAVAALLQPSCFDSIILIKKLPYLPDLLSSASRMYDICVEDFMVRDVKYIWNRMTFQQLKDLLKENKTIKSFPLVDSPTSMVLLGSIHRWELVRVIEKQVGRSRRLQVAAQWLRDAERRRQENEAKKRRPSRFEVTPAPDMLQVPGTGMTRGSSLTTKDQGGLIPSPGQLFRPKSILKKTNSFTLTRGLVSPGVPQTPLSPPPSVYTTVTGAETRIRAAFEAIFKRSSLLPDVEGGLPDQLGSLPRSPSINKKVQLPRERVCDMSPEDQKTWEQLEMAKEVDFDRMLQIARRRDNQHDESEYEDENLYICHIDPAPFQLVERTSLLKVHSLFSTLGVKRAYVTAIGRLIGVVSIKELRKAIEDVNSGALTPATRPAPPTTPMPMLIKVQASEPAPPTDSETAKLTTSGDK